MTTDIGRRRIGVIQLAVLVSLLAGSALSATATQRFQWQAANHQLLKARSPADYNEAAEAYQALMRDGTINAHVAYNHGCALLMAGEIERAIRSLLRAERYTGTTRDIRHNLRRALAADAEAPNGVNLWYRTPLFWHFGLPTHTRACIAATAFSLTWIIFGIGLLRHRHAPGPLMLTAVTTTVIFASSVALTLHAEMRDRADDGLQAAPPQHEEIQP